MARHHSTKLSSTVTVLQYYKLEEQDDRQAISKFIRMRFDERYFIPIESTPSSSKHGFTTLAICCLVIETLESFYQGLDDTKGQSRKLFNDFFQRETPLKIFAGDNDWFFTDIRCGILHQSETRNGWKILRRGPLLDKQQKTINATSLINSLRSSVKDYSMQLLHDDNLWNSFRSKMKSICANCS